MSFWRHNIPYLEDHNLKLPCKDMIPGNPLPPRLRRKHCRNIEFLLQADLKWLTSTSQFYLNPNYDPKSESSYFEQSFTPCKKIGEGSYATVLKVKSQYDCSKYSAVKISKEPFRSESDRKTKLREVLHHEQLSEHPNIVMLYNAWEEDRFLFMHLELCKPCSHGLQAMPEDECWNVLSDLLQALDHIHSSGRVHLDIKTENILIGKDRLYKLADFGLTIEIDKNEKPKEGDYKYVAPELVCGRFQNFSAKADIFSLGISVLELATNLDLPRGGQVWNALRNDINIPYLQTEHLSDEFLHTIIQMMTANPANRPSAKTLMLLPKIKANIEQRLALVMETASGHRRFCPRSPLFPPDTSSEHHETSPSSTTMAVCGEIDSNENVIEHKFKRDREDEDTEEERFKRILPPKKQNCTLENSSCSHSNCNWNSITSVWDHEIRHCPSQSLLKFGISPIRLCKQSKQQYEEEKHSRRQMARKNLLSSFASNKKEEFFHQEELSDGVD